MKTYTKGTILPEDAVLSALHIQTTETGIVVYEAGDIPPIIPVPVVANVVTVEEFRKRFTDQELASILALDASGDATVKLLLLKLWTRQELDLSPGSADATQIGPGLDYLISQGALTADRKSVLMA